MSRPRGRPEAPANARCGSERPAARPRGPALPPSSRCHAPVLSEVATAAPEAKGPLPLLGTYDPDNACGIDRPDEARRLYGAGASSYEESFGRDWDHVAPREIAGILKSGFGDAVDGGAIPDAGAGTAGGPRMPPRTPCG